jgi:hypothetical protein
MSLQPPIEDIIVAGICQDTLGDFVRETLRLT